MRGVAGQEEAAARHRVDDEAVHLGLRLLQHRAGCRAGTELRTHIVEFLINADEWASHMNLVIAVMWKATDQDTIELSNSEMAKQAGELRYAVTKELKHLLGLVGDRPLQQAVHVFHDLWLNMSDQMIGPVTDKKRKSDFTAVEESMKYLGRLRRATTEIRNAALPLLRVTIEDLPPVRWWQIRRRKAARRALST